MGILWLAWHGIRDGSLRSWFISLCCFYITLLVLCTEIFIMGAQASLRSAVERVGADIVVVPEGSEAEFQTNLLMGGAIEARMPSDNLTQIAGVPGAALVSPQLYVASVDGRVCCAIDELSVIAFEPGNDFAIASWLQSKLGRPLRLGEAVGGADILPNSDGQGIELFGYDLTLAGTLQPTGTNLDRTLWVTWDAAQEMARASQNPDPSSVGRDTISAAMVKVAPGAKIHDVAVLTRRQVPGVTPIERAALFGAYRHRLSILSGALRLLFTVVSVLSLIVTIQVFAAMAREQRRRLGVLRALGATRKFVLRTLMTEAGVLAVAGALLAVFVSAYVVYGLRDWLVRTLGIPFVLPSPGTMVSLIVGSLLLAVLVISLTVFVPAWRTTHMDPGAAMRG